MLRPMALSNFSDSACKADNCATVPTISRGNRRTSAGTIRANCVSRSEKSEGP